jgi:hypothetical protein
LALIAALGAFLRHVMSAIDERRQVMNADPGPDQGRDDAGPLVQGLPPVVA